jgi:pimeloyl-ACP methyl ester carboxylesterase
MKAGDMRTRHIDLADGCLDYGDVGSGRAVVCVHGYLTGGDLWEELAGRLAERGYRVLTPTWHLGAHRSGLGAGADRSPLGHAGRIAEFLESLDLDDVLLVGNDSGGALCQLVAAHHPQRLGAMVLTNCDVFENFPPSVFKVLRPIARSRRAFAAIVRALQFGPIRRSPAGFGLLSHEDIDGRAARWVRPAAEDPLVREDTRALTRQIRPDVLRAAEPAMRRFTRPVLMAWGVDDRLFPVRDAERLAAVFPNARVERVARSRTFVMVDQPDRLATLVAGFAPGTGRNETAEAVA